MPAPPMPLTWGRRLALALGVPVSFALIGWLAFNAVAWAGTGRQRVHLAVPARGGHLSVGIDSGQVNLVPGAGRQIVLTGTARYSLLPESLTSSSSASGVIIDSACPVPAGLCELDYAISVPAGQAVSASSGAGNVVATSLRSLVSLSSGSGDVVAMNLAGRMYLSSGAGNVTGTGLTGSPVTASDGAGDVSLTFARVPRLVVVSDSAGNITIVLPPGPTAYRVDAHTSAGSTNVRVPTSPSSPYVIRATGDSGNITIVIGR